MKLFKHFIFSPIRCLHIVLAISLLTALSACEFGSKAKPVIAVSIKAQQFVLQRLAGENFDVVCLLGDGKNPEVYEPDLTAMMALERSDAFFMIGNIGFESAIVNKAKDNNEQLRVFNTSKGVELITSGHGMGDNAIDPHVWASVRNVRIIARNMLQALEELAPDKKDEFRRNFNELDRELTQLDKQIESQLRNHAGQAFVVWHPSLSYFARDYNLKQVALNAEDKEASAAILRQKFDLAKQSNAKIFFIQKEYDSRQAVSINQELGLEVVEINVMSGNWIEEMQRIANALAKQ